jgi:crotonobetaine/carnitine-CoA ligase
LRRRGENISSVELERIYASHGAIELVAVHAVPSEISEDDVKVTVVLKPGALLSPRALFEWSLERMPYFALPRYIEFREELPVSGVGRIHKYQLRAEGCTPTTWDRDRAGVTWEKR